VGEEQRLKPGHFAALTARLKLCPDTKLSSYWVLNSSAMIDSTALRHELEAKLNLPWKITLTTSPKLKNTSDSAPEVR
jgi:hypothetical protein